MSTVRSEHDHRKPVKIGLDTFSVRLTFSRAGADVAKWPMLPGFTIVRSYETHGYSGQVYQNWSAIHPDLKIRVHAHELETWIPPDEEDPVVSGKIDVTFEVSRIKSFVLNPDLVFFLNDKACSSAEAGSIVVSLCADIAESLDLGDHALEVLRLDVFCDFTCDDHRGVLDRFARRRPKVWKTQAQPTTVYDPHGTGSVIHKRYKGDGTKGCEETRLYPRIPKIAADLNAAGLDEIAASLPDDQILRLEAVHGKERKGGCRPLRFLDDYTARVVRAGDEDPDESADSPPGRTLSLVDALDPRAWAGILLERLRELELYGADATPIEVALSRSDLRKRLVAAGVCRGTASQYADIVFEGEEILRAEGCKISKIRKKVESIMGKTYVSENEGPPHDVFADIAHACIILAKAGDRPDPSAWTRIPILRNGTTQPVGTVQAVAGHGDPLDPAVIAELETSMDEIDKAPPAPPIGKVDLPPLTIEWEDPRSPPDTATPAEQGTGSVEGQADQTNETLVRPMSAQADAAIDGHGGANWTNDLSLLRASEESQGADRAPATMRKAPKPNTRKRKPPPEPAPDPESVRLDGLLALVCDDVSGELKETTT